MRTMRRLPRLPDPQEEAEQEWLAQQPISSWLPSSHHHEPPRPSGGLGSAAVFGAIAGGVGGAAMFAAARAVGQLEHIPGDFAADLARHLTPAALGSLGSAASGLVSVIAIGALAGLLFGMLTRHLLRVLPRMLFFGLLMPILWILLQAFVVRRFMPALAGSLPLLPLSAGAVVYGLCLAVARPLRAR